MGEAKSGGASAGNEVEITLGLLNAVEENSAVTQRSVAGELGIALGLANAYLKRCVKKGLIKVQQIPPNRYAYYLTPQGFSEKTRLTAEYLSSSFNFFRRARADCEEALAACVRRGRRRVALWGASELAEIVSLCAAEYDLELIGIVDGEAAGRRVGGLEVRPYLTEFGRIDAVIVTDLRQPQAAYDSLAAVVPEDCILTPRLLRVRRPGAEAER